jgi:hypothetical protein
MAALLPLHAVSGRIGAACCGPAAVTLEALVLSKFR